MADIKILKGGKINQQPSYQPDFEEPSNYQPGIAGRLGLHALQGVEAPLRGLSGLLEYLGEPGLIRGKTTSEDIMSKLNISPQQIEAQSLPENIAQKGARLVPTSLALGGLPAALATAIGSVPSGAAQYLGAPEPVQDALQLATELGAGVYSGKLPRVKELQKRAYNTTKGEVPKGAEYFANTIDNAISNVESNLGTEVNKSISSKVNDAIEVVKNNISQKKINPNTALDLRKKLYQLRKTVPEEGRFYIDDLTKGINNYFSAYGAENPRFFNKLKIADKLTEMKNMKSYIADFAEDIAGIIPGNKSKLLAFPIKYTFGSAEKLIKNVYKNPVARRYYFEMVKAAAKQDPALFIKQLENFDNLYEEKFTPEAFKQPAKFKILSGGKI